LTRSTLGLSPLSLHDALPISLEFALLIANGMKPMEAIFAATRNAADLLGRSDEVGSIQAGRWADIVAIPADPTTQPEALRHVGLDRKSTRLNSSHVAISYAVF